MCGICGVVSSDPRRVVDAEVIERMRDTLVHRGPDECGIYVAPGASLGHRRLSIIDLRPEGRQPIANEDGSIQIVFNGEIYNFAELRRWLEERGHRFRSATDTEVIVHLYEECGVRCLEQLRGMFAFAIWDQGRRRLFLARDRVGKKPLYYAVTDSALIFASEAKAILANESMRAEPDYSALNSYLSFGYVPGEMAAYKGVWKLPPAHYLIYEKGRVSVSRYWRLDYCEKHEISEPEAREEVLRLLREAVKVRMVSDVPLGAFLSGGLDSSAVVALMSQLSSAPVKTFSIGFKNPDYNETAHARAIARRFGTDHHEFIVEPEDAPSALSRLAWHYDEPYADSSALATYYLARMTREHVTVALSGDGGDESFAGYKRYTVNLLAHRLGWTPALLRKLIGKAISGGYTLGGGKRRIAARLALLGEILSCDRREGYMRAIAWFSDAERSRICTPEFLAAASVSTGDVLLRTRVDSTTDNAIDEVLALDVALYLPEDCLTKVDRATMAVSLEARCPMVDHELMEFAARLPAHYKMNLFSRKLLLKDAMRGLLPDEQIDRAKMGFGVPLDYWFRDSKWTDLLHDVLLSPRALARGYFVAGEVENLIREHTSRRVDRQHQLWALLMLELWHRTHVDHDSAATSSYRNGLVDLTTAS